jgi:hypothetical protein
MNFCDSAMEIITEKMMHRTETWVVKKKDKMKNSVFANHLFFVYIFFLFYSLTLLIFSSNLHISPYNVYTQLQKLWRPPSAWRQG